MRRISVKYARPGMVLGAPVYTCYGTNLLDANVRLDERSVKALKLQGIREIVLDDPRVSDVHLKPLFSPEVEGKAARVLRQLLIEAQRERSIGERYFTQVVTAAEAIGQELTLDDVGEISSLEIVSLEDYNYAQPVKVAGLCLLMGKRLGYGLPALTNLALAALLKDVGYILMPPELLAKRGSLTEEEVRTIQRHPADGYELLSQLLPCDAKVAVAVLQHHERWNGIGYPQGLKGSQISPFAQVIAIADTYIALLSKRPHREMRISSEAVKYIMASGGKEFNPELIPLFVREVPVYRKGLTVRLNTGEVAIVSDANFGFIGRPTLRICCDENSQAVQKPYDMDLSQPDYQNRAVSEVLGYY